MKVAQQIGFVGTVLVLNLVASAAIQRTWVVHQNTGTTNVQIEGWHSEGTVRLNVDDDGAGTQDVPCCVKIESKGITRNFTYVGGNDVLDNDPEILLCLAAFPAGVDSGVMTSEYTGTPGLNDGTKIIILSNPDASTLVHEIGHIAGLGHVSVDRRIMTASDDPALTSGVAARTRVTQAECDAYAGIN